jgi:hypothetical protein
MEDTIEIEDNRFLSITVEGKKTSISISPSALLKIITEHVNSSESFVIDIALPNTHKSSE